MAINNVANQGQESPRGRTAAAAEIRSMAAAAAIRRAL